MKAWRYIVMDDTSRVRTRNGRWSINHQLARRFRTAEQARTVARRLRAAQVKALSRLFIE